VILFELYAFLVPAFSPTERRVALPVMLAIPGLFASGVAFGYFVVLRRRCTSCRISTAIVRTVRAGDELLPVRGADHARDGRDLPGAAGRRRRRSRGIVSPRQLRKNRRYAIVVAAAIAALLPATSSR